MKTKNYFEALKSNELKGRLCFNTFNNASMKHDIMYIWFLFTPTGRQSKFWHTVKFNSARNISDNYIDNQLKNVQPELMNNEFKSYLKKGYTISEPYKY